MALKIIGTVRTVLLYSTTAVFGVVFSGIFLAETITTIDILSLALVLTGIFLLRNRLAGKEENKIENQEKVSINTHSGKISVKRGKYKSKISISHRIEEKVVSQGWIGAG